MDRMNDFKYRLKFHLMPPTGWMNDPNGLCFYKGLYHVFFQYAPSGPCNYERYWGHYTSPDLLHWKYEGIAIKSDCDWDRNGAFSGCGFTEDGMLEVFYTGNVEEGDYDYVNEGRGANVIYLRSEDGLHFSEKKLLLTNADYPADYTCHVRDPKVWKEENIYHMVLGGRKKADRGAILHYVSEDKITWMIKEEITSKEDFGFMWECPDLFELDGKTVLMCCPQGVAREEFKFQNPHQAGYWIVTKTEKEEKKEDASVKWLCINEFRELDKGFDFYAPQTFLAPDGRRILYGWGGVSEMDREYRNIPIIKEGWQHSLTVPRELKLDDGVIKQYPIRELEALRYEECSLSDGLVNVEADAFDLEIVYEYICETDTETPGKYELSENIKQSGDTHQRVKEIQFSDDILLSWNQGIFSLCFLNDSGCGRKERKARIKELRTLRMLKDVSMLEIYINGGEYVFTTRYFPKDTMQTALSIKGCSEARLWKMKRMEVDLSNGE